MHGAATAADGVKSVKIVLRAGKIVDLMERNDIFMVFSWDLHSWFLWTPGDTMRDGVN